jgi:hypothetical protein
MPTIRERINQDLKEAMKNKEVARRNLLRNLLSAFKQEEIDNQKDLNEEGQIEVLMREAKKRRESIEEYEEAGRDDSAQEERAELEIIESYLPEQMSREEIRTEAEAAIAQVGASSPKDMGKVMGVLMPKVKGKADGKLVNEVVRKLLNS